MLLTWGSSQGLNALMNSAEFIAGFADKGSGEVDLTLAKGTGAATFTRATTATTVNSAGLIVSVASGVPRSYYDPTTLAYRGYLAEGARTNLVLNSLIDGTDFSTQSVNVTAVAHTLSFYGTGTITLSGASTAGPLVGTGVYPQRVSLTFTPTAASLTLTVTGSCKFVQLEVGSFASSFIPTAGASVTRNADVLTYPVSGNASASVGSAYAEVSTFWTGTTTAIAVAFDTGNNLPLYVGGAAPTTIYTADGVNAVTKTGLSSMATGLRKRASSYGGSTQLITGDGLDPQSGTFDGAMASTAIAVGCGTGAGNPWFGTIRNVRIYQTQLSAAQLQAVTA
jgi:hypothetical protein